MEVSPVTGYCHPFRSAESNIYSSEPCLETTADRDDENSREDLTPLNLSTRKQDKEKSPFEHRPRCSDTELPLNLSLRASYSGPVHSAAPSPSEDLQPRPDTELDEEPCDQRQTAALALCQLAIATSSSCDFSAADRPSEDSTDTRSSGSPKKTKHTAMAKKTGVKRANSGQADSKCHKPNKRAKAPGWALRRRRRRRPRCC